jgi:hypothetical protein
LIRDATIRIEPIPGIDHQRSYSPGQTPDRSLLTPADPPALRNAVRCMPLLDPVVPTSLALAQQGDKLSTGDLGVVKNLEQTAP